MPSSHILPMSIYLWLVSGIAFCVLETALFDCIPPLACQHEALGIDNGNTWTCYIN